MPDARVIDLSHHNVIPKSLQAAKDSGICGIIHKLTEGFSTIDPKALARYTLAQDACLEFGCYHFLKPGDVKKQAAFFLSKAAELGMVADQNVLFACDFEEEGISLEDVLHFLQAVESGTGRVPVLYSGHNLKELNGAHGCPPLARYRLWLSQYGPKAVLPAGFLNYWLWQYTDKGKIPGIQGNVDLNHFDGTDEELKAQWSGKE